MALSQQGIMSNIGKKLGVIIAVVIILIIAAALVVYKQAPISKKPDLILSNYPELFKKDVIIVVGENATQIEMEGAQAIAGYLGNLSENAPLIRKDVEITEKEKARYNLILVGRPDANSLLRDVYERTNATRVTQEYPGAGKGVLEILRSPWNEEKAMLLVAGSDEWGIRTSSNLLRSGNLNETSIVIVTVNSKEPEIIIYTDKDEYKQGEKVNVTFDYEGVVYVWNWYGWSIRKWEKDSWVKIQPRGDRYFICAIVPECKDVNLEKIEKCPNAVICEDVGWIKIEGNPEHIIKFEWDQSRMVEEKTFLCKYFEQKIEKFPCVVFEQVLPGKYKIRFEYTIAINPNDTFSREIDIKYAEKEIVIK